MIFLYGFPLYASFKWPTYCNNHADVEKTCSQFFIPKIETRSTCLVSFWRQSHLENLQRSVVETGVIQYNRGLIKGHPESLQTSRQCGMEGLKRVLSIYLFFIFVHFSSQWDNSFFSWNCSRDLGVKQTKETNQFSFLLLLSFSMFSLIFSCYFIVTVAVDKNKKKY